MAELKHVSIDGTTYDVSVVKSILLDAIYPVGSIYISVTSTSPQTLFGGTWVQIKDTFLLSAGDTYNAGDTGGEATHTLTVNEMPSHNHKYFNTPNSSGSYTVWVPNSSVQTKASYQTNMTNTGGGGAHNNMPPYLAVYMWQRTA